MAAGKLTHRITVQRQQSAAQFADGAAFADGATFADTPGGPVVDAFGGEQFTWVDAFSVWAERSDLSDSERAASGQVQSARTSRFKIRDSDDARSVTPRDRIIHEGQIYNIHHVKEALGGTRRKFLEITAATSAGNA